MSVPAFLLLLPASVWLLGAVFNLLDGADRAGTVRRIAWRGLPFVLAALLLGNRAALPALAAVLTALLLHVVWTWAMQRMLRHRGLRAQDLQDG